MNEISITHVINTMATDLAQRYPDLSDDIGAVHAGVAGFDSKLRETLQQQTAYGLIRNWEGVAAPAAPAIERVARRAQQEEDAAVSAENTAATLMPNSAGAGFLQVRPDRARTPEELSQEQWIWSEIRQMPAKDAQKMYVDALARRDLVLSQTFERMPAAFSPLASADQKHLKRMKYESLAPEHRADIEQKRERAKALRMLEEKAKSLISDAFIQFVDRVRYNTAESADAISLAEELAKRHRESMFGDSLRHVERATRR